MVRKQTRYHPSRTLQNDINIEFPRQLTLYSVDTHVDTSTTDSF